LPLEKGYEISRNAAIGMCIIQPMKNSIESYPTKMFEYMAIGLPQIISNFRLYRSVVEKHQTGFCVDPGDAAAIAAAIDTLLKQPDLREQMRKQALQAAPEFDWSIEQKKLFKLYERLLKLP
jgi:glycosyltransferase involved in cell wall biosynthesis